MAQTHANPWPEPTNPCHGCGFGVGHLSLTHTHTQAIHTHIPWGFPIPVTGTNIGILEEKLAVKKEKSVILKKGPNSEPTKKTKVSTGLSRLNTYH